MFQNRMENATPKTEGALGQRVYIGPFLCSTSQHRLVYPNQWRGLQPYYFETPFSRTITEVKQYRDCPVPRCVTAWKNQVQ